jgi:hypothetical protein
MLSRERMQQRQDQQADAERNRPAEDRQDQAQD